MRDQMDRGGWKDHLPSAGRAAGLTGRTIDLAQLACAQNVWRFRVPDGSSSKLRNIAARSPHRPVQERLCFVSLHKGIVRYLSEKKHAL